jgi:hypothetical protein
MGSIDGYCMLFDQYLILSKENLAEIFSIYLNIKRSNKRGTIFLQDTQLKSQVYILEKAPNICFKE